MQMPPAEASTRTMLDSHGTPHETALHAEASKAEIAPIDAAFSARQGALRGACEAREAAERTFTATEALQFKAEEKLEGLIRQVEGRVLLGVGKKRTSEPYVSAFPGSLGAALAPKGKSQSAEARRIAEVVGAEGSGAPADAVALLPAMLTQANDLDTSVDATAAAEKSLETATAVELSERRRWREQYRKDFGLLTAVYPTDKKEVESFFKKPVKAPKKPAPAPAPVA